MVVIKDFARCPRVTEIELDVVEGPDGPRVELRLSINGQAETCRHSLSPRGATRVGAVLQVLGREASEQLTGVERKA